MLSDIGTKMHYGWRLAASHTSFIIGRVRLESIRNKKYILGIYSSYSALGSRKTGMKSKYSGMRIAPKRTLTVHYSNHSYSGLIPNERALDR